MTLSAFIEESYTCYHAAENAANLLRAAGFSEISDKKAKNAAGVYRVVGGSLFAAKKGNGRLNTILCHPFLLVFYEDFLLKVHMCVCV